jgi:NAD(P)-dependent dehydrogenase (short-subunit alcohol dehydrogenase family)
MEFANYPSLKDKVVFITGGTSGIGSDFVKSFAQQGARVAFVGRSEDQGRELCDSVKKDGSVEPLYIKCDVGNVAMLQDAIAQTGKELGDISVLVNNAANDKRHQVSDVTEQMWDDMMGVNLKHQFFTAQAVYPMMQRLGGGSILNIGSNCFLLSRIPQYPLYAIAKSAIIGLTRSLAREFGADKVRVNAILPGWVMTEKQINQWVTPEAEAEAMEDQCLKERLYEDDISRLALFLAADDSHMITKQTFIADAGRV